MIDILKAIFSIHVGQMRLTFTLNHKIGLNFTDEITVISIGKDIRAQFSPEGFLTPV